MSELIQINFRMDEKNHTIAKRIIADELGSNISAYLKKQANSFVTHEISISPNFNEKISKEKRVSVKIENSLYEALKKKSTPFNGVSGIFRAILENLIDANKTES